MNVLATSAAIAALCITGTAAADTICDRCAYAFPGTYLGAHWTGDRSTVTGQNASPVAPIDHYFVVDVNENATVILSASGAPGLVVAIQYDQGSLCASSACSQVVIGPLIAEKARKVQARLVAGRYVLHVQGPAGGSYSGLIVVR